MHFAAIQRHLSAFETRRFFRLAGFALVRLVDVYAYIYPSIRSLLLDRLDPERRRYASLLLVPPIPTPNPGTNERAMPFIYLVPAADAGFLPSPPLPFFWLLPPFSISKCPAFSARFRSVFEIRPAECFCAPKPDE